MYGQKKSHIGAEMESASDETLLSDMHGKIRAKS